MLIDIAKRKKKKSLPPRTKRMKRSQRMQSAKQWLNNFYHDNVIRAYRKRYSVGGMPYGVTWEEAEKEG
ncbi:hypothetical protein LCGC14_3049920, partial [marine sediment metagenome]